MRKKNRLIIRRTVLLNCKLIHSIFTSSCLVSTIASGLKVSHISFIFKSSTGLFSILLVSIWS